MKELLDEAAVRHVAHLARLSVTDEEVARFAAQLSSILQYFDQLKEVDTSGVEPTAHPLPVTNVFREDTVLSPWTADAALHNAPQHRDQFFQVPKVLEQEEA